MKQFNIRFYLSNEASITLSSAMQSVIPDSKLNVSGLRLHRFEGGVYHPNYVITKTHRCNIENILKNLIKISTIDSVKTLFEKDGIIVDKVPVLYNTNTQTYSEQNIVSSEDYANLINNINPIVSSDFISVTPSHILPLLSNILNLYLPQVKIDEKKNSTNLGEVVRGFIEQNLTTKFNISEKFIHFLDYYINDEKQNYPNLLSCIVKNCSDRKYPGYVINFISDIVSPNTNKREGKKKINLNKLIDTILKGSNYYKINISKFNSLETIKFIMLELLADVKFEIETLLTHYSCHKLNNVIIHKTLYKFIVEKNVSKTVELLLTDFPNNVPFIINPNEHSFLLSLSDGKLIVNVNSNFKQFLLTFIEKYKNDQCKSEHELLNIVQPFNRYDVKYLKKILIDALVYITSDSLIDIESNLNKDVNHYSSIIGIVPMDDEFKFLEHIKTLKPITNKDMFLELVKDIELCFTENLKQKNNYKIIECVVKTHHDITVEDLTKSMPHINRIELTPC